jgi:hypothetical protein
MFAFSVGDGGGGIAVATQEPSIQFGDWPGR